MESSSPVAMRSSFSCALGDELRGPGRMTEFDAKLVRAAVPGVAVDPFDSRNELCCFARWEGEAQGAFGAVLRGVVSEDASAVAVAISRVVVRLPPGAKVNIAQRRHYLVVDA